MAITSILQFGTTEVGHLASWEQERGKLWAEAGRTMSGDLKATLVGVFPKIKVRFTYTTKDQLSTIVTELDKPVISVKYYDTKSKALKTANFYAGDYSAPIFSKERELFMPFDVSLIPYKKYT